MKKFIISTLIALPLIGFCAQIEKWESKMAIDKIEKEWNEKYEENSRQTARDFFTWTQEKEDKFCREHKERWIGQMYEKIISGLINDRLEEEK